MIFIRKIDENGLFIEDIFVNELTEFTIVDKCPGGFFLPRWDRVGKQWIEGKTQAEIDAIKASVVVEPTLEERVGGVETEVVGLQKEIDILFGGA